MSQVTAYPLEAMVGLLETLDNLLWGYLVLPFVLVMGIYFTFKSKFLPIRRFPAILHSFYSTLTRRQSGDGVHPLKAFFTCIGGCMGVGNVVSYLAMGLWIMAQNAVLIPGLLKRIFCAGIKCADFMGGKIGRKMYYVYAVVSCLFFAYFHTEQALTVMSINAAMLLLINLSALFKLRNEIDFQLPPKPAPMFAVDSVAEEPLAS